MMNSREQSALQEWAVERAKCPCPSCGKTRYRPVTGGSLPVPSRHGSDYFVGDAHMPALPVAIMTCAACGYVLAFDLQVVLANVEKPPSRPTGATAAQPTPRPVTDIHGVLQS